MPARRPETAKAAVITVFARMPISRVIVKSSAEARIASPRTDLRRNRFRIASAVNVVRIVATSTHWMITLPTWKVAEVRFGMLMLSARGPRQSWSAFWMIRLRPREVSRSVRGGAFRTGRKAIRSISTAVTPPVRIAIGMNDSHGQPASPASSIAIPEIVRTSPCAKLMRPSTAKTAAIPIPRRA